MTTSISVGGTVDQTPAVENAQDFSHREHSDVPQKEAKLIGLNDALPMKKAALLAVLAGIVTGLAHPLVVKALGPGAVDPTGLSGLLIFVSYVPLLFAVHHQTPFRAFLLALLAFTTKGILTAHWLVVALSHFGGLPFVAGVIAMVIVIAFIGSLFAAAFPAMRSMELAFGIRSAWLFPVALCGVEFARTQLPFGGAPWVTAGMALAPLDVLRQSASLVGVTGLAAFVGLINASFFSLLQFAINRPTGREKGDVEKGAFAFPMGITTLAASSMIFVVGFGVWRLNAEWQVPVPIETLKVGLLQASIPQDVLNNAAGDKEQARENRARILKKYHELQGDALVRGVELVVWPEAALRPGARADAPSLTKFGAVSRDDWSRGKADLASLDEVTPPAAIVGSVAIFNQMNDAGRLEVGFHTSAFATESRFKVVGRWDKKHLLPFGELTPWPLGAVVAALVHVGGILQPGKETPVLAMSIGEKVVKIGTSICYEGVFSNVSRDFAKDGAQLHVNITNDAWYGVSSEMEQHLQHYAMRATESGIPIVRAANSGISAYYDDKGRLLKRTSRDDVLALIVDVPLQAGPTPTLYTVIGDVPALIALLFALLGWLLSSLKLKGGKEFLTSRTLVEHAFLVVSLLCVPIGLSLRSLVPLDEGLYTLAESAALWGLLGVLLFAEERKAARRLSAASHVGLFMLSVLGVFTLDLLAGVAAVGPILGFVLVAGAIKQRSIDAAKKMEEEKKKEAAEKVVEEQLAADPLESLPTEESEGDGVAERGSETGAISEEFAARNLSEDAADGGIESEDGLEEANAAENAQTSPKVIEDQPEEKAPIE
ncbi:MAG: apolipoprotein N-acyltransferase [Deltaproteobacteria bacterium]|nr:apolipoprotein N-acyltransferase [Deltaproteobacteria bacterium]